VTGQSVTGQPSRSDASSSSNLAQAQGSGPVRAKLGGPVCRLGSRTGGDIVGEQVDAGVRGLAAAVGLGGFLPLLGPDGQYLGLDPYGRLVCVQDGKLLAGARCVCGRGPQGAGT
jgi:hypothetical protein